MWHHGYVVSPQWERELELDSVSGCDNAYDAVVKGEKNYISVIRECSSWILIRDSLCPPDILSQRTGRKWNNAKLYGEFAALRFFLMTKNEEAPTLQSQNGQFVFLIIVKIRGCPQCDGVRRVALSADG